MDFLLPHHMIILHENLPEEAERIAKTCKDVLGFDSKLVARDLTASFKPAPKHSGYFTPEEMQDQDLAGFDNKKVLVLTSRDIYDGWRHPGGVWTWGCW